MSFVKSCLPKSEIHVFVYESRKNEVTNATFVVHSLPDSLVNAFDVYMDLEFGKIISKLKEHDIPFCFLTRTIKIYTVKLCRKLYKLFCDYLPDEATVRLYSQEHQMRLE